MEVLGAGVGVALVVVVVGSEFGPDLEMPIEEGLKILVKFVFGERAGREEDVTLEIFVLEGAEISGGDGETETAEGELNLEEWIGAELAG